MIVGDGVEKRYGRKRALKGVSFSVPRAGFLLVTGPNGSGKTTLLRLVAGLAAATKGTLTIDAERGDLGYLGHEPLLYRELTALTGERTIVLSTHDPDRVTSLATHRLALA